MQYCFTRRDCFWRDTKHIVVLVIILLAMIDLATSTVLHEFREDSDKFDLGL
jgi:hypothetical protein